LANINNQIKLFILDTNSKNNFENIKKVFKLENFQGELEYYNFSELVNENNLTINETNILFY
jgi:hypothetical protein